MLYFILGFIAGLLINPFREETKQTFTRIKNNTIRPHATFSEPQHDITNIENLKDIIHE